VKIRGQSYLLYWSKGKHALPLFNQNYIIFLYEYYFTFFIHTYIVIMSVYGLINEDWIHLY